MGGGVPQHGERLCREAIDVEEVAEQPVLSVVNDFPNAGHAYVDAQGAFAILPVFQLGLFVALWVTVSTPRVWRRLFCGLLVLALTQVVVSVGLGELFRHIGVDLHVSLIRAWALSGPVALVWLLERPQPESPRRWPRLRVLTWRVCWSWRCRRQAP